MLPANHIKLLIVLIGLINSLFPIYPYSLNLHIIIFVISLIIYKKYIYIIHFYLFSFLYFFRSSSNNYSLPSLNFFISLCNSPLSYYNNLVRSSYFLIVSLATRCYSISFFISFFISSISLSLFSYFSSLFSYFSYREDSFDYFKSSYASGSLANFS